MILLRNILAGIFVLISVIIGIVPIILSIIFKWPKFIYFYNKFWIKMLLKILRIKVILKNIENIDFTKKFVLISNHLSNLDGPIIVSYLPINIRVMIKHGAKNIPIMGKMMETVDFVFVDRSSVRSSMKALDDTIKMIKEKNYSFLIFPEGTRSKTGRLQKFKRGAFIIPIKANVPILPLILKGTYELMPKESKLIQSGKIEIEFFDFVYPDKFKDAEELENYIIENIYKDLK